MHLKGDLCRLDYVVHYSSPSSHESDHLQDNSQTSSINTRVGQAWQLFDIVVQGTTQQGQALPGLGKIPLLGPMLSSHHQATEQKKIIALARLEQENVLPRELYRDNVAEEKNHEAQQI